MILYSQVFIVRHPPAVLSAELAKCSSLCTPLHRLGREVGDDAVAADREELVPLVAAVHGPRHDLDVLRVHGVDRLAIDVIAVRKKPRDAEPLCERHDVEQTSAEGEAEGAGDAAARELGDR